MLYIGTLPLIRCAIHITPTTFETTHIFSKIHKQNLKDYMQPPPVLSIRHNNKILYPNLTFPPDCAPTVEKSLETPRKNAQRRTINISGEPLLSRGANF